MVDDETYESNKRKLEKLAEAGVQINARYLCVVDSNVEEILDADKRVMIFPNGDYMSEKIWDVSFEQPQGALSVYSSSFSRKHCFFKIGLSDGEIYDVFLNPPKDNVRKKIFEKHKEALYQFPGPSQERARKTFENFESGKIRQACTHIKDSLITINVPKIE